MGTESTAVLNVVVVVVVVCTRSCIVDGGVCDPNQKCQNKGAAMSMILPLPSTFQNDLDFACSSIVSSYTVGQYCQLSTKLSLTTTCAAYFDSQLTQIRQ